MIKLVIRKKRVNKKPFLQRCCGEGYFIEVITMTIASYIDHSLLRPNATREDILEGARLCSKYQFGAYCVNSVHVETAVHALEGTRIPVAATVAFPFGSVTTRLKAYETRDAAQFGAQEIDMVAQIGSMLEDNWAIVTEDIKGVVDAAEGRIVKVIIETGYLNRHQILLAIEAIVRAGAHFVKNSTGYGPKGADIEEMSWIRKITPKQLGVKAAGGIRSYDTAVGLISHGIDRIGSSVGPALVEEGKLS